MTLFTVSQAQLTLCRLRWTSSQYCFRSFYYFSNINHSPGFYPRCSKIVVIRKCVFNSNIFLMCVIFAGEKLYKVIFCQIFGHGVRQILFVPSLRNFTFKQLDNIKSFGSTVHSITLKLISFLVRLKYLPTVLQ